MGVLHLPGGLTLPTVDGEPRIYCARKGCGNWTRRDIRMADSLPAPADAGWYEVQIDVPQRTTFFACSERCAMACAAIQVPRDLRSTSDRVVLPDAAYDD